MADISSLIEKGLFLGQQFTSGTDQFRIVQARGKLLSFQSKATGRITSDAAKVLTNDVAKRLKDRDDILKELASHLVVLLSKSLHDLTATQYATLKELAAAGHPYAKNAFRDARGRVNPRLKTAHAALRRVGRLAKAPGNAINAQSFGPANLDASFRVNPVLSPGGVYTVLAASPLAYSAFLSGGTDHMIARPFDRDAAAKAQSLLAADVKEAAAKLAAIGESIPGLKAPEIDFDLGGTKKSYK